jgi:phosphoglycerol transferase
VLPRRLTIMLKARAFGPNADQPFILRVGRSVSSFRVPATARDMLLQMETDGTAKTMTIEVPQPVSPRQLGQSGDTRQLGLGLVSLEISSPVN